MKLRARKVLVLLISLLNLSLTGTISFARSVSILEATIRAGAVREALLPQVLQVIHARAEGKTVLFGLEMTPSDGKDQKRYTFRWGTATLREVLDKLVEQDPRYTYDLAAPNVVHIYPLSARADPEDLLNIRVKHFRVESEDYSVVLSSIRFYVPELDQEIRSRQGQDLALGSGVAGTVLRPLDAPKFSLELQDVTVREILNRVLQESLPAQAHPGVPAGWIYQFKIDESLPGGGYPSWWLLP